MPVGDPSAVVRRGSARSRAASGKARAPPASCGPSRLRWSSSGL